MTKVDFVTVHTMAQIAQIRILAITVPSVVRIQYYTSIGVSVFTFAVWASIVYSDLHIDQLRL